MRHILPARSGAHPCHPGTRRHAGTLGRTRTQPRGQDDEPGDRPAVTDNWQPGTDSAESPIPASTPIPAESPADGDSGPVRTARRAPGRPRDPDVERAILEATLDLLAEGSFAGLSIEAVAARAGAGKATVYRRWQNKELLVIDAVATLTEPVPPVLCGDMRTDLVSLLESVWRNAGSTRAGRILPGLLAERAGGGQLFRLYQERVIIPRRQRFRSVLEAGMAAGSLRADLDVERAIDLLVGPVLYRSLLGAGRGPVREHQPAAIVDDVLLGLRVRPASDQPA